MLPLLDYLRKVPLEVCNCRILTSKQEKLDSWAWGHPSVEILLVTPIHDAVHHMGRQNVVLTHTVSRTE